jgi:hypothetical protein
VSRAEWVGALSALALVLPLDFWLFYRFPWWEKYWLATPLGFFAVLAGLAIGRRFGRES